jgi:hypothetical protein
MIALNRDMGKTDQALHATGCPEDLQRGNRFVSFFFRTFLRPFQRTAGRHRFQNGIQKMAAVALLDRPRIIAD